MRRPLLFLLTLLLPAALPAQMMPDSTVQVVAYWEVGDRMDYTYVEKLYEVDADNNETLAKSASQRFRLEVVEATDSTYTLEFRSDEMDFGDLTLQYTAKERAAMPEIVYRIRTNHLGSFLGVVDLDKSREAVLQRLPVVAKAVWRDIPPAERGGLKEKDFEAAILERYTSDEFLASTVIEMISPLLFYHGARLDTTANYSLRRDYASLLFGGSQLELESLFAVDAELTDEYSAVLRAEAVGDEIDLLPLIRELAFDNLKDTEGLTDDDYNDFLDAFDEEIHAQPVKAVFLEYVTEEVELATGWPIQWIFDHYETISQGGVFRGLHLSRGVVVEDKIGGE